MSDKSLRLSATIPNPTLLASAVAALFASVFAVPGSLTVPTVNGDLLIQRGFALFNNGSGETLQTAVNMELATPWPNGFILGFCEDSDTAPSFAYSCSLGGQATGLQVGGVNTGGSGITTNSVTLRSNNHYVDDASGSNLTRATLAGQCRSVWIAFGY
jgi:hypothetical protein